LFIEAVGYSGLVLASELSFVKGFGHVVARYRALFHLERERQKAKSTQQRLALQTKTKKTTKFARGAGGFGGGGVDLIGWRKEGDARVVHAELQVHQELQNIEEGGEGGGGGGVDRGDEHQEEEEKHEEDGEDEDGYKLDEDVAREAKFCLEALHSYQNQAHLELEQEQAHKDAGANSPSSPASASAVSISTPADHALLISNLNKLYPPSFLGGSVKHAVRDVSFACPVGERFGLLGINGAGKTTTLGVLTSEIQPTSGDVLVAGCPLDDARSVLAIGYCPQVDPLLELMNAYETLFFFGRIRGIPEHILNKRINSLIEQCGLSAHAKRPCGTYSGGNKRKLSLAVALIGDPKVLFLDEPSTGMDPEARRSMWSVIEQVSSKRTIVLVSHSMEECEALCTRVGIMVSGRLKCLGSPQHIKSRFGAGYQIEIRVKSNDDSDIHRAALMAAAAAPAGTPTATTTTAAVAQGEGAAVAQGEGAGTGSGVVPLAPLVVIDVFAQEGDETKDNIESASSTTAGGGAGSVAAGGTGGGGLMQTGLPGCIALCQSIMPACVVDEQHGCFLRLKVGQDVNLALAFEALESNKARLGILDYR